jgi:hypothetical protein
MRSFTFDVVEVMNAAGRISPVEGTKWIKLAHKMVSEGLATLVENSRSMTGSGTAFSTSHEVCYLRVNMTVTEKVN